MRTSYINFIIVFLFLSLTAAAQKYKSPEVTFEFQSGIYLNAEDFAANKPSIPISKMVNEKGKPIKKIDYRDTAFYYLNGSTTPTIIEDTEIFGIGNNGFFYAHGDYEYVRYFGKLEVLGSLSRFYCMTFPYAAYNKGIEMQYFIDIESGKSYPFDFSIFNTFLSEHDPELHKAFNAEKPGFRALKMNEYLDRYNAKHPAKLWN